MSGAGGNGQPRLGAASAANGTAARLQAGGRTGVLKAEVDRARSVVVGTAGHIDHGKTALVWALTGTDTDRLPEEKARGITIDLGFAAMELVGEDGMRLEVSLVDVPGHHAFVRNMLAGAGGIDAVMLVVAADEGVKEQTVEHLQICRLLGIERGVVVLTKRDVVAAERLAEAHAEVGALVEGTFLEGAPSVAVAALRREGIGELKAALARVLGEVPRRNLERVTRLPVDRVFTVRGFGTVVTGTLQSGSVRAGENLHLQPGDRPVRVRGVQVHGKARAEVWAPNRVALNLAGLEVGEVARGDAVVPGGTLRPVQVVDAEVELLPGMTLRHRQRVRVHALAAESLATALLYDGGQEEDPGTAKETGRLVRLRLIAPMVLAPGDRFVLRLPSPAVTVGGGCVLDVAPLPRERKAATRAWLELVRRAGPAEALLQRIERRGRAGTSLGVLVSETGLDAAAVCRWLALMVEEGKVIALRGTGGLLVSGRVLAEVEAALVREIERAPGAMPRAELRSKLRLEEWVFGLALGRLQAGKHVELYGEGVASVRSSTPPQRQPSLHGRAAEVDGLYRSAGLASPILSEAATRLGMRQEDLRGVVTTLLRAKRLVRLGSDALLVHTEALEGLKAELKQRRGERFDVAGFKTLTGLTRKHVIPLLEHLDGARVTRNMEGVRVVL